MIVGDLRQSFVNVGVIDWEFFIGFSRMGFELILGLDTYKLVSVQP